MTLFKKSDKNTTERNNRFFAVCGKYAYGAFNSPCGNGCSRIR